MKIGIISVATGNYLKYWQDLVSSADNLTPSFQDQVTFYCFTNRAIEARETNGTKSNLKIVLLEIPNYRWPEATLYRYKLIDDFRNMIEDDFLIHLDADMLIRKDFLKELPDKIFRETMTLVQHPGFWRPRSLFQRILFYFQNPITFFKDTMQIILIGGLGDWENNLNSTAYVKRSKRSDYYCGAVWMGPRHVFLDFAKNCAMLTKLDLKRGHIAKWHDESYLNKWASENHFYSLTPAFCFVTGYKQLKKEKNLIEAVTKTEEIQGLKDVS